MRACLPWLIALAPAAATACASCRPLVLARVADSLGPMLLGLGLTAAVPAVAAAWLWSRGAS